MRRLVLGAVALLVSACGLTNMPPMPPAPRIAATVNASFGKSWDATIDVFAERGIAIETLDRASGLIVPRGVDYLQQAMRDVYAYADCGRDGFGSAIAPRAVKFNVVVRGDSTRSTIQVRTFYVSGTGLSCSSTGRYENDAETMIVAKAEGRPTPFGGGTVACTMTDKVEVKGRDFLTTVYSTGPNGCAARQCTLSDGASRSTDTAAIAACRAEAASKKDDE